MLESAITRWSGVPHSARVLERLTPKQLDADARTRWRRGFWITVLDWVAAEGFRAPGGGPRLVRDLMILRHEHDPESGPPGPRTSSADGLALAGPIRTASDGELPAPWHEWWLSHADAAPAERPVPGTRTEAEASRRGAPASAPGRPGGAPGRGGADAETSSGRAPASAAGRTGAALDDGGRAPEDEAIYLGGAGAVLVHPFLEQLFRERGLLAERNFRGVEARQRAVRLIGLLTFGIVDVPEYALVLAKVLCGAALEDPLEPVPLEPDDLAACDTLLRAVLEHWTALRSTSPEWLREQFFLREGKLERVDSGYRLTIERRAQDVLLARLPWGCCVIAVPWLNERMFVRWLD
jgi:contractile injection system tape measure protein